MNKAFRICLYLLGIIGFAEILLIVHALFIGEDLGELLLTGYVLLAAGIVLMPTIVLGVLVAKRKVIK